MILMIVIALLILGVAFFQAVQGLFSALLMAILAVLCAALAFNYYEPLANMLLGRQGGYAHGPMLLALFFISLLVLRFAIDRYLPGNVNLGLWPDRLAGFGLGLVTALIMAGVLMISVGMLPLSTSIVTWQPYDDTLTVKDEGPPAWASHFTMGMMKYLSANSLSPISEEGDLAKVHDDIDLENFGVRNRPAGAEVRIPPQALEVSDACELVDPGPPDRPLPTEVKRFLQDIPRSAQMEPQAPTRLLVIRCWVSSDARDSLDDYLRLPATQFRLIDTAGQSFYPVGYLTYCAIWHVETQKNEKGIAQTAKLIVSRPLAEAERLTPSATPGPADTKPAQATSRAAKIVPEGKLAVDWVYRIPAGSSPSELVFRRGAVASVPTPSVNLLPPTKSTRGIQLALRLKPQPGSVKFEQTPQSGPFQAEKLVRTVDLPDDRQFVLPEPPYPAPMQSLVLDSNLLYIQTINLATTAGGLRVLPDKGRLVRALARPLGGCVYQVELKVSPESRFDQAKLRKLLQTSKPQLAIDDGSRAPCVGLYVTAGQGDAATIGLSYDLDYRGANLPDPFPNLIVTNYAQMHKLVLLFAAKDSPQRSVVGMTFGMPLPDEPAGSPNYEFFTTAPLLMGGE